MRLQSKASESGGVNDCVTSVALCIQAVNHKSLRFSERNWSLDLLEDSIQSSCSWIFPNLELIILRWCYLSISPPSDFSIKATYLAKAFWLNLFSPPHQLA